MHNKRLFKNTNHAVLLSFLSGIAFVYIILFEFILPVNQILPKPSILINSFSSLISDYAFINSYLFTLSIIYSVFLASYFLLKLFFSILVKASFYLPGSESIYIIVKYFIPIFLIFLFELWFGSSIWGEIIFVAILVMGLLKKDVILNLSKVKDEYLLSAQSLGLKKDELIKSVYWESFQPNIFNVFINNHFQIWSLVLIYEYICGTSGLGNLLHFAIKYNDLSVIILVLILLILMFILLEYLLNQIKLKFFFWESLDD